MKNYNYKGVTHFLSNKTIAMLKSWDKEEQEQAQERAVRARMIAQLDEAKQSAPELYSDLHKDLYGFRPRG